MRRLQRPEHAVATGSDYFAADAGYDMAMAAASYVRQGVMPSQPPSQLAAWTQQALAAHARCKHVLPGVWMLILSRLRGLAQASLPWFQQLAQAGDSWAPPPAQAVEAAERLQAEQCKGVLDPNRNFRCTACGSPTLTLKVCAGCRVGGKW